MRAVGLAMARGRGAKALPYKARLEYLESSGTQYIDTGITPNSDTSVEIDVKPLVLKGFIFASEVRWSNNAIGVVMRTTGMFSVEFNGARNLTFSSKERAICSVTPTGASYGGVAISYTDTITGNNYPIFIFGGNRAGNLNETSSIQIYFVKITEGLTLVRNLIPVLDNADTPCMYDEVSGEFFYNQGTGSFIAGPVVGGRGV